MEKGTLGLAMRNPNDKGWNPMEPMVVKEGQLTASSEALDPQTLAWVTSIQRMLNPQMVIAGSRDSRSERSEVGRGDPSLCSQPTAQAAPVRTPCSTPSRSSRPSRACRRRNPRCRSP